MTKKAIAALALVLAGACGRGEPASAPATTTVRPATVPPATAPAPASAAPSISPAPAPVTVPDLSDVDGVLAGVDADLRDVDADIATEGAPS